MALHCLHCVSETMLVELFSLWNKAVCHGGRVAILEREIARVKVLAQEMSAGLRAVLQAEASKALRVHETQRGRNAEEPATLAGGYRHVWRISVTARNCRRRCNCSVFERNKAS